MNIPLEAHVLDLIWGYGKGSVLPWITHNWCMA
jgi:hypothetical protein